MDRESLGLPGDITGMSDMQVRISMILATQFILLVAVSRLVLLRVTSKTIHRVGGVFFRGLLARFLLFHGLKG